MRILKLSRCFYPTVEYSGLMERMLKISKSFVQKGHNVTVYKSNLLNFEEEISSGGRRCLMLREKQRTCLMNLLL